MTKPLSPAELARRRMERQRLNGEARRAAGRQAREGMGEFYVQAAPRRDRRAVSQDERVRWALARMRTAQLQALNHPDDRVYAVALAARKEEYETAKRARDLLRARHAPRRSHG